MTIQDVVSSLRTHFLPLFDPECSVAAVVAGPSKVNDVTHGLESIGFEVEQRQISMDLLDGSEDGESGSSSEREACSER